MTNGSKEFEFYKNKRKKKEENLKNHNYEFRSFFLRRIGVTSSCK
jgi:hypothetical protein